MEKIMRGLLEAVKHPNKKIPEMRTGRSIYQNQNGEMIIFLSISDKEGRSTVVNGKGTSFKQAAEEAAAFFHKQKSLSMEPVYLKLDLVTSVTPKGNFPVHTGKLNYKRRTDGLVLNGMWETAFLPEEVDAYGMIENKRLKRERMFRAAENHFQLHNTCFLKILTSEDQFELAYFRTNSYFIDETGVMPLFRGHRVYSELTEDILRYAIELPKNHYFMHSVNKEGRFLYSYEPATGTAAGGYNILRHAGTLYAMLETYECFPEEKLLTEAKRALRYLLSKVVPLSEKDGSIQVLADQDIVKLGGNGLAVVALAKYTDVTGDEQYMSLMRGMAEWMLHIQDEKGNFAVHKQKFSTGEISPFVSWYYPGEAMLALTRLYEVDPQERWLNACEKQAEYLIHTRDKKETKETIEHDHWLLYALTDLHEERGREEYLNHALFIARAIVDSQRKKREGLDPEWTGSYEMKGIPRSTPVACRSEGLGAACRLALRNGLNEEAETFFEAMKKGILFQLQMQLRPESVMYYDYKDLCLGALHESLTSYELRNDYTQHNVSSFISCY
ncbi:MAG: hypothetical protein EA344_09330, partial [Alkalicoccus sp.]